MAMAPSLTIPRASAPQVAAFVESRAYISSSEQPFSELCAGGSHGAWQSPLICTRRRRQGSSRRTEKNYRRQIRPCAADSVVEKQQSIETTEDGTAGFLLNPVPTQVFSSLGDEVRRDFPILHQEVNDQPLIYFDSAATSQKPIPVLRAMEEYNTGYNSNVHRGVHTLSARATDAYENAREKVAKFVNAPSSREIVFTRNATEAINLVAASWGRANLHRGDEIVLTVAEHHSNIVPWQLIAEKTGAVLKYAGLRADETVRLDELKSVITKHTKIVAIHHISNTLGSISPLEEIVKRARRVGALVLLDACQSVPHMPVDVQALDVDFLVASGHKMCGPTGIGFLYGRSELLRDMPPYMGGGEMIADVFLDHSTYAEPPSKFEAGTPAIAEAIGLGAAIDYLQAIGMEKIHQYEMELVEYLYAKLTSIKGVRVLGPPVGPHGRQASLCAFTVSGIHPTDLSTFLDQQHGLAIRSGHHCTQPLHRYLGMSASARASLSFYNTREEIDRFIAALEDTIYFFTSFSSSED
eukprot:TRINITY_DN5875_c0_g1_i1.p1 TRINITY_DN5875_c0_g1~~TRINITY_DN5875_c0_g1_i1.p1  ORF type:complete len:537 (-),score=118.94 TRINITY_DN5875_c0_g1_i1:304-1878(-)